MKAVASRMTSVKQTLMMSFGLLALVTLVTGCGHHDRDGYNGDPAYGVNGYPSAPGGACLQSIPETSPTYTQTWGAYRQNRITPYAWNQQRDFHGGRRGYMPGNYSGFASFPQGGLCGCQQAEFPACGPQGMTCIPGGGFGGYQVATWGYNNGAFGWNGFNNYGGGFGGGGGCYNNVAQICQPGQVMGGAICQPVSVGNPYGVWVQHRP